MEPQQPQVESAIALDIVNRGLPIAPVIVLVAGLIAGWEGAASAAIGVGIVFVNFLAAAAIMSWASGTSPGFLGGAALGGYVLRLAVILVALFLLRDVSWINLKVLGFTMVGTHMALLTWEMKYVSMQLAAPGLKPRRPAHHGDK